MCPKIQFKLECPHAECEEHYSTLRGTLTRTIICRHPENDDCLCVLDPRVDGVCVWFTREEPEPEKTGEAERGH